jgi:hypothetical protein
VGELFVHVCPSSDLYISSALHGVWFVGRDSMIDHWITSNHTSAQALNIPLFLLFAIHGILDRLLSFAGLDTGAVMIQFRTAAFLMRPDHASVPDPLNINPQGSCIMDHDSMFQLLMPHDNIVPHDNTFPLLVSGGVITTQDCCHGSVKHRSTIAYHDLFCPVHQLWLYRLYHLHPHTSPNHPALS